MADEIHAYPLCAPQSTAAQRICRSRSSYAAAAQAYQEGLDRIRCIGGWRIDALTGRAIDLERSE